MSGNWYCMRRGWQDHDFFAREPFTEREAWEWLIGNAAWKETTRRNGKGENVTIQRGQIHVSDRSLASAWQWDKKRVRRTIEKFVAGKMLDQSRDQSGTVLTVINYAIYQDLTKIGDAEAEGSRDQSRDRSMDQSRDRSGDHTRTKEPVKPVKGRSESYAFDGRTIRLNRRHYDEWSRTYHAIPDLLAELTAIDSWFDRQPDSVRKDWWPKMPGILNKKHQEMLGRRDAVPARGGSLSAIDDSFLRRLDRFEAQEAKRRQSGEIANVG